jgi:hypothetical protein
LPWPWTSDTVEQVVMNHVLEHLGETSRRYLAVWQELYRVMKNAATMQIVVPHWRHQNFDHDPTHVRKVTPFGVKMFDQMINRNWIDTGNPATPLGLQLSIDFEIVSCAYRLDSWFKGDISQADRQLDAVTDIEIVVKAHKPGRVSETNL